MYLISFTYTCAFEYPYQVTVDDHKIYVGYHSFVLFFCSCLCRLSSIFHIATFHISIFSYFSITILSAIAKAQFFYFRLLFVLSKFNGQCYYSLISTHTDF